METQEKKLLNLFTDEFKRCSSEIQKVIEKKKDSCYLSELTKSLIEIQGYMRNIDYALSLTDLLLIDKKDSQNLAEALIAPFSIENTDQGDKNNENN